MNAPWRHHSVAQFQLRHFADAGGELWHFNKKEPHRDVGHDGPRGIFYEPDQYSTVDYNTGELDPTLEHFFDKEVENPAAPVVKKIVLAARKQKPPQLSADERALLDQLMLFQARRVPELADRYDKQSDAALNAILADLEVKHGPLPDWFDDPNNRAMLAKNAIVDAQGAPDPRLTQFQRTRGLLIAVITDPRKSFVIGSNPMVPFPPPGFPEFGVHGYWLPLASDVAVSLGGPASTEDVRSIADHAAIRRFNEVACEQSDRIAGRSKALIESLIKRR